MPPPAPLTIPLPDERATVALGARIGGLIGPGDAVLLSGPLGAGKTTLARAMLRAACADPDLEVPSPSYTLLQSYDAPGRPGLAIHHLDLWRLDGPDALPELGWDDLRTGAVVVEWPDRLGPFRPAGALAVDLDDAVPVRLARLHGWTRPGWP